MNKLLTTAALAFALITTVLSPAAAQTEPMMGMMGGGCPTMGMMGMMGQDMMAGQGRMGGRAMMGSQPGWAP